MFDFPSLQELVLRIPPLLFALTLHEFAHGYVAYLCGDDTARLRGRLTFNPLAHLDPMGTLCILFAPIGWAKPVPVNPANFKYPRRDDIFVSLAGVAANLATAVAVAILLRGLLAAGYDPTQSGRGAQALWIMGETLCLLSITLTLFNLVPLFPLDGSHVLRNLLPPDAARAYDRFRPIAPMVLLILVFTGAIWYVIRPPMIYLVGLILGEAFVLPLPFP